MDGAKHYTDTLGALIVSVPVSRRGFCAEHSSREGLERKLMRILVIVGCDFTENVKRRKSKVSLTIYVSQGLVST
jgi:hypothetical protein